MFKPLEIFNENIQEKSTTKTTTEKKAQQKFNINV